MNLNQFIYRSDLHDSLDRQIYHDPIRYFIGFDFNLTYRPNQEIGQLKITYDPI